MAPIDNLTTAERAALAEVRKLLGDNLANFLLAGLGQTSISYSRTFIARSIPTHGDEGTYQFEMVNDSELGLPIERDPLVLAALLNILWERQPLDSTIHFRESDILEKLEWPYNAESQELIRRAVARYVLTAYCLIAPILSKEENLSTRFLSIGRVLIGFEMVSPLHPLKRSRPLKYATSQSTFASVHFLPGLIHDVISERKTFLGVDFQRLSKVIQASTI